MMAINVGVCTISFSAAPIEEALAMCAQADARGVEIWGRDHLPDDAGAAEVARVRALAARHGLTIAAYGAYARAGHDEWPETRVAAMLDRVVDLGAPVVRVWAGQKPSAQAGPDDWMRVGDSLRAWGDLAAARGLRIVVERHCNTLTDFDDCAYRLITEVAHESVRLNYQVPYPQPATVYADLTADLRQHLPLSAHIHVQNYRADGDQLPRATLTAGIVDYAAWQPLLTEANFDGWAMLEFLPDIDGVDPADVAALEVVWLREAWDI